MPAIGVYIHVPFCASKCPYCDFYSLAGQSDAALDAYTDAVARSLRQWRDSLPDTTADTLYFGGGTPSLLGGRRLARLVDTAAELFGLCDAEITMEANPCDLPEGVFADFRAAGGNRVSLGMQAVTEEELRFLGRRHRTDDVQRAVDALHAAGIENLSLDIMLGLQGQTPESVAASAEQAKRLGAKHVSAYLLKIEPGTPFDARRDTLVLPDEDAAADGYLEACRLMESLGFRQYEISNFALPGYESRHNLKYWNAEPYLGIGPSAHSFLNGRRLYYPRRLELFMAGIPPLTEWEDGSDAGIAEGGEQEYLMLRLRLTEGAAEQAFEQRFGHGLPGAFRRRAARLAPYVVCDDRGVRLTREGFLVSNAVLAQLLDW